MNHQENEQSGVNELSVAVEAVKEAARISLEGFQQIQKISYKEGEEIVTEFDVKAEQAIRLHIKKYFPEDNILGEEQGTQENSTSARLWIIDPIDGTVNYSRGIQMYGVSLALAVENQVIAGVVYNPVTHELFTAEKGKGSFLNGSRVIVSNRDQLSQSVIYATELYKTRDILLPLMDTVKQLRITSSSAYETCHVAAGRTEAFIKVTTHPWGFAAANLIVEEAGGVVTNFDGTAWDIHSTHILSSNKVLHQELLDLISTTG